ncbi:uncharacterized protein LOC115961157 [Quercus lobata]|uniref:uncharacterized protein LOC115961157 n=1 Tax=Quercus lobata TaxID=97700 RepID=UPI00124885AF|nr:uncharacterized protein LOC115961157 [Quercus lobata]
MDVSVIEDLQHLRLTKDEEEDIQISSMNRSDLMEECALSLFGKLLTDRQHNQRALKNTLRAAWKMGSDLRIVDVGKNLFQFKFNSGFQLEWVERNGPWNFENNLLLLCRWKKGLSATNITFTHAPFWVQIWGLPFENLSEDVGKDLGNSLGHYLETDKRMWLTEQARFLRIRVNIPLNKPLRRGGNILNCDGEKTWVNFKYERLPSFCYVCGFLGHDEKHCQNASGNPDFPKQYGEWLRATGSQKNSGDRQKSSNSWSFEDDHSGRSSGRSAPTRTNPSDSTSKPGAPMEIQVNQESRGFAKPQNSDRKESSQSNAADFQGKNSDSSNFKLSQSDSASRDKEGAVGSNAEDMDVVSEVGRTSKSHQEAQEVSSPLKPPSKSPTRCSSPTHTQKPNSPTKPSQQNGKPKIKRIAREKGKQAHGEQKDNLSGNKRPGKLVFDDNLNETHPPKRLCDMLPQISEHTLALSAVAAKQHRRAQ